MLKKIQNVWGVVSDEGYTVTRVGSPMTQFYIEYSSGSLMLRYPLENLVSGSVQPIRLSSIGPCLPPNSERTIKAEEKAIIAKRIVEAMKFLGDSVFEIKA